MRVEHIPNAVMHRLVLSGEVGGGLVVDVGRDKNGEDSVFVFGGDSTSEGEEWSGMACMRMRKDPRTEMEHDRPHAGILMRTICLLG